VVRNRGTTNKINIEFMDNVINVNNFAQLVYFDCVSGIAASDYIVVNGDKCPLSGKYALYPDAHYSRLPVLRIESETWRTTVTPAIGRSVAMAPIKTFKWVYPRQPTVQTSWGESTYIGNRISTAIYRSLTTRQCRIGVVTDDGNNFSASVPVVISATVGIHDV
jgi:hypothetical protein